EALRQLLHTLLQQASVRLELGLARPAQADGAAALAFQVGPAADQTGRDVAQLRQFDLQFALGAARALREDVQDQARAVDDPAFQRPLQVALLDRAERVV